jgi:conjugal transfer pilus assembly protein TraL
MRIPPTISAPSQLLGKDMDEVAVLALIFMLGILTGQLTISIICLFVVGKLYKKFRGGVQEGYLMHIMYNTGLYIPDNASTINPFIKELS